MDRNDPKYYSKEMIDVKEKCSQCTHHATCKFSEEYEKFNATLIDKISEWDGEYYTFIPTIEISCKYFAPILDRRLLCK